MADTYKFNPFTKKLDISGSGASTFLDLTDTPSNYTGTSEYYLKVNAGETAIEFVASTPGAGDVVGPGSSTDNAIVRFDGVTGKLIQDSDVVITDTGRIGVDQSSPASAVSIGGGSSVLPTDGTDSLSTKGLLVDIATGTAYAAAIVNDQPYGSGLYIKSSLQASNYFIRAQERNTDTDRFSVNGQGNVWAYGSFTCLNAWAGGAGGGTLMDDGLGVTVAGDGLNFSMGNAYNYGAGIRNGSPYGNGLLLQSGGTTISYISLKIQDKDKVDLMTLYGSGQLALGRGLNGGTPDGLLHLDNAGSHTDMVIEKDANKRASIRFHNAGVDSANITFGDDENIYIENDTIDKDIIFKVNDGGVDTEVMRVDGSTGKVGIGTVTPSTKLDVDGAGTFTTTGAFEEQLTLNGSDSGSTNDTFIVLQDQGVDKFAFGYDKNTGDFTINAGSIVLSGAGGLSIDSSNNLWINTLAQTVTIDRTGAFIPALEINGSDGLIGNDAFMQFQTVGVDKYLIGLDISSDALVIQRGSIPNTLTAAIVIDANDDVGIGKNSPDGKLHIDNGVSDTDLVIEKDAGTQARVVFHNAGVEEASISYDASEDMVFTTTTNDFVFTGGNFGIDVTTPSALLQVGGNMVIGKGEAGVDYTLTFDGESNDGVIKWKEDEDEFEMSCDLSVTDRIMAGGVTDPQATATSTIADYGSGSHTITAYNGAVSQSGTTKVWGYCYDFDGVNDYVSIDDLTTTLANATTGSISTWVYFDADSGNYDNVWSFGDASQDISLTTLQAYGYFVSDSFIVQCYIDGTQQWRWTTADNWLDDKIATWFNITVTHNGTEPKIYYNGSDITSSGSFPVSTDKTKWFKAVITDATNKADNFALGCRYDNVAVDNAFDGKIDDIRVFTDELTSGEVTTIYGAGSGTTSAIGDEVAWVHGNSGGSVNVHAFGTTASPMTSLSDSKDNVYIEGDLEVDGRVRLPYLGAAPATLVNGDMWMESDGLHIYYGGAEKVVAGT